MEGLYTLYRTHHIKGMMSPSYYIYIYIYIYILKNEGACGDIKPKKAQRQDWDGTFATKLK